jgi:hypothetical protein
MPGGVCPGSLPMAIFCPDVLLVGSYVLTLNVGQECGEEIYAWQWGWGMAEVEGCYEGDFGLGKFGQRFPAPWQVVTFAFGSLWAGDLVSGSGSLSWVAALACYRFPVPAASRYYGPVGMAGSLNMLMSGKAAGWFAGCGFFLGLCPVLCGIAGLVAV